MRYLTKSRFKTGLECPNKLYYTKKDEYANQKEFDPFLEALASGGFQVEELAKSYPDVTLDFLYVDNAAMQMILNPKQFDVILTGNMFGDIISDEASVIGGSIGLLPSASVGEKHALFEPIHGSFPQATGKNIANPIATILSVVMLLEHFGLYDEAETLKGGVEKSINLGITTTDLGQNQNDITTSKVGDFIADYISHPNDSDHNFNNIHLGQSTII